MSVYIQLKQQDSLTACDLIMVIGDKDSNNTNVKIHRPFLTCKNTFFMSDIFHIINVINDGSCPSKPCQ